MSWRRRETNNRTSGSRSCRGGLMKTKLLAAVVVRFAFTFWLSQPTYGAPTDDVCSLRPASQLEKTLRESFGGPQKLKAPPAYRGQPVGTHCTYTAEEKRELVVFIVYTDPSAAEAKETFDQLSAWFPAKSKPSVGDSAYTDSRKAIHVLKGEVATSSPPTTQARSSCSSSQRQ